MAEKSNGNAAKGGVSKKEAVRQALSALGMEAPRLDLHKFIKEHYNLDMTLNHISSCKGEIQQEKKPKKAAMAAKPPAAKQEQPKPSDANSIRFEDIESVKNLVERVGADSLRKLIAMLAK
jgi:hypothetical protein